jgi:alcohol dehydrogenase
MRTRAAVLNAIGSAQPYATSRPISIEELEFDAPGPGEVVVRIVSAGLCHSDLSNLNGTIPKPTPLALGHEAAGVVEDVGAGVTHVKSGDHVVCAFVPSCGNCEMCLAGMPAMCIPGHKANFANALLRGGTRFRLNGQPVFHHLGVSGFAERTVVAEESLVKIPDDVPLEFAAVFGCGALTGLGAIFNVAKPEPWMTVAVFGAGGVGLMAVLAALACGARVVVVDPLAHKRALAIELGAALTIDPAEGDPGTQIMEKLGIRGVQYAIEATGIPNVVKQALLSTAPGGTAIALGVSNPKQTFELAPFDMLRAERTLRASFMGAASPRRDIPRYIEMWHAGKLPVEKLLSGQIGLDGLNAAFDHLAAGDVVRQMCVFDHA